MQENQSPKGAKEGGLVSNKKLRLPTLRILEINSEQLTFSYQEHPWIGERHWAYLMPTYGTVLAGRFKHLDPKTRIGQFILASSLHDIPIEPGTDYKFLDGYWGERAEIVFGTFDWQFKEIVSRDASFHSNDGITKEISGGWDHEHCSICWESMGPDLSQTHGYVNQLNDIVCQSCYQSFIVPKSLDFINIP